MTNYEIDILKRALLKIEQKEVMRFKNLPCQKTELSKEFENNIHKLAKKRKNLIWQATKTVPRRIAFVFIAAIITFCMMMSISAIRLPVVNFFVNIYEEFISVFIEEDEDVEIPDTIEEIYHPSYMIDNYTLLSNTANDNYVENIWMDTSNNIMILTQDILKTDYQVHLDNQGVNYQPANFTNTNVHFMSKNGQYIFIWTNEYYLFELICSTQTELDEIEKLIDSLSVVN